MAVVNTILLTIQRWLLASRPRCITNNARWCCVDVSMAMLQKAPQWSCTAIASIETSSILSSLTGQVASMQHPHLLVSNFTHTHTHTTILRPSWILSRTTWVSLYVNLTTSILFHTLLTELLFQWLPSVLWCCWLGSRKKNCVVGCWCGYLSGARCIFAYGPDDATATLASVKSTLVLLPAYPRNPWQGPKGRKMDVSMCVLFQWLLSHLVLFSLLPMPVVTKPWVRWLVASVTLFVCSCSERKTARAITTKLGRHTVNGSLSAWVCTSIGLLRTSSFFLLWHGYAHR